MSIGTYVSVGHKVKICICLWPPEWSRGFPHFLQLKSEFGNKELMIWATVSSQSCFCWLYSASPSLAAKNIINLISVLTSWWCPCVESSLVLLEEAVFQIPYDYTLEVRNRFKGLDLIESLKNYGGRFMTLYKRQGSRPSPRKRNAKRQNGCLRWPYK